MVTILQETYYAFNKQVFSCLCPERNVVEEAVEGTGFDVKFSKVQSYLPGNVHADHEAPLSLVAGRCASITRQHMGTGEENSSMSGFKKLC